MRALFDGAGGAMSAKNGVREKEREERGGSSCVVSRSISGWLRCVIIGSTRKGHIRVV